MRSAERVRFLVDELVVDVDLGDAEAQRVTPVLKAAFEDLARRIEAAPAARWRRAQRVVLAELRVDALSADELLGPRGAARLADAFWAELNRGGS